MLDALSHRNRALLLAGAALLAFGAAVFNQFVDWDDVALILENPFVQGPFLTGVHGAFTTYDPELYIPLTLLSFQVEHLIHGNTPSLTHALNILLHIGNALLVWRVVALLLKNERNAFLVALLFAVHPLQTEAVAWATGRKDLLSGLFCLASLYAYLRGRTGLALGAFLLGLMAKVTIAPLPFALLLIERKERGRIDGGSFIRTSGFFALALLFVAVAVAGKSEALGAASPLGTLLLIPYAIVFQLQNILMPLHLAPLYPFVDPITVTDVRIWSSFIVVGLIAVATLKASKKHPIAGFGALFFLIMLLPNFANFRRGDHFVDIYVTSDRSVYLALIGFFLMLTPLLTLRPKIAERVVAVLAIVFIGLSILQTRRWRDTDTLFIWTAYVSPYSHVAQMNVGNVANREGRYAEALDRYALALSIREAPLTMYNAGKVLAATGQTDEAIAAYTRALELDPTMVDAALNIGTALLREGRTDDAIKAFKTLSEKHPDYLPASFNWAVALSQDGRDAEAIVVLERLVTKNPEFVQGLRALAELYTNNGRAEEAQIILQRLGN